MIRYKQEKQRGISSMKNTVIFDLDGLLINSEVITYKLYNDLLGKYNTSFSLDEYIHSYCGQTAIGNMEKLIEVYHLPITVAYGLSFMSMREQIYLRNGIDLKPGAKELLYYLITNQYKIILASSSTKNRALNVLSKNGIGAFFDNMVFGSDVKKGKPYPDIFLKACEYANEKPENCLVLEDSEAGIQAAHSAEIDVICIPDMKVPSKKFKEMETDELESLDRVIPWLENSNLKRPVIF